MSLWVNLGKVVHLKHPDELLVFPKRNHREQDWRNNNLKVLSTIKRWQLDLQNLVFGLAVPSSNEEEILL